MIPGHTLQDASAPQVSERRKIILWIILGGVVAVAALLVPPGYDYAHFFGPHIIEKSAMPWTDGLMYWLPWPLVVALTVVAVLIAVDRRGGSPWTSLLALLSLPTIWVILIGQLDGVALLGLTLMPQALPVMLLERRVPVRQRRLAWLVLITGTVLAALILRTVQGEDYFAIGVGGGNITALFKTSPWVGLAMAMLLMWIVPVALLKPQLTTFAMLSRKSWTLTAFSWLLLSIAIWGWWLPNVLLRVSPGLKAAQPQDIALFPWSLIIAIPLLWLGRGDPDLMMAGGSFALPSIHPYHYIVLMPALARLPVGLRLLCWLSSFLPLTANYFGPTWWLTGNVFPVLLWLSLYWQRRRIKQPSA